MPENLDLAELERLLTAAMGCPHSLGEGAKPVHELTNYLTTHLPANIAMGAECEWSKGELGKSGQLGVLPQKAKDALNEDRHHLGRRIEILETQLAAVTAECERLRGEREKLAKALIKTWGVLEPICPWGSKDKIMSEHAEALEIARRITK